MMDIQYGQDEIAEQRKNRYGEEMHVLRQTSEYHRLFSRFIQENTNFFDSNISLMNVCSRCDRVWYDDGGKERIGIIEKDGNIISRHGYLILEMAGGKNGGGVWSEYLEDLSILFHNFSNKGYHAYMLSLDNDCADDVFYPTIGVR